MIHTLQLYFKLIQVQLRSQAKFRGSFFMDILATLFLSFVTFGSLALVMQRFKTIGGWNIWELAFLYGILETAFGMMDMIFSGFDPRDFGRQVRLGRLDQLMLRPASLTVQVLGSEFLLRRLGRISQGLAIFGLALANLSVAWDLERILLLLVVIFSTMCFFGGLFIFGSAVTFWTIESIELINIFTYGGVEMMSYPMNIYSDWLRSLFTYIIPASFLVYYPSLFLLGKTDPTGITAALPGGLQALVHWLSPLVGIGMLAVGRAFWEFGLKHYQSTGT